ncbi:MAG: DUF3530 family protein [Halopseudomonas sp.]|uniref:DUF3530 family protein n=1 Tax=Halopseudomonas sp. TaxID=2901191 RepID=UPI003002B1D6
MRAMLLSLVLLLPLCASPAHAQTQDEQGPSSDATGAPAEATTRGDPPSRRALYEQVLERELPTQQQRQLDFGGESQLGLFLPAARPKALGGILLIAGPGEHADWPQLIAPARRQLSDAGWNTLSISLPDAPAPTETRLLVSAPDSDQAKVDEQQPAETGLQSPDNQPDQPPTEADAAASATAYAQRCTQLIQAAWQVLTAEGDKYVAVIARNEAGYWALRAASPPANGQPPHSMVIFAPRDPGLTAQPALGQMLEGWDKPLLEMVNTGNPQGASQAKEHQRIAQRKGYPAYQQWDIDYLKDSVLADAVLQKRLQGWVERALLQQPVPAIDLPESTVAP